MAMSLPVFAGGSRAGAINPLDQSTFPALDRSEPYEVIMYYSGDIRPRQREIFDNFNNLARAKINTTLDQRLLPTSDWRTTYPLLFASGEVFDLAYAATWIDFAGLARRGSFMPLQHLAPRYAPTVHRRQAPSAIVQASIGDNLYGLPSLVATYSAYGPIFRTDLVEGRGWNGRMTNLADLEAYLDIIRANYPAMEPIQITTGGSEIDDMWMYERGIYGIMGGTNSFFFIDPFEANPRLFTFYEYAPVRTEFLPMVARWNQKGLFPSAALTDTTPDKFRNGISAARIHNIDAYDGEYRTHPTWGIRWENFVSDVSYMSFTQDTLVVASSSRNPHRALDMWEAIMTDEQLYRAFYFGIENVSYRIHNVRGQDYVEQTDIIANQLMDWTRMWAARTPEFYLPTFGAPEDLGRRKAAFDSYITEGVGSQKFRSFVPDISAVETEWANLINAHRQYWWPLELAYVPLEQGLADYQRAMEAAGVERVRQVLQGQLDEYIRNFRIPGR